jgi:hypothetical protein
MKYIAAIALVLNLGVTGLYARDRHVNMRFSGTAGPSSVDLQIPDRTTGGDNFTGNGTLGAFTFREVESNGGSPEQSSTCSGPYFTLSIGAGVLSFQDGSSLILNLTEGSDCIDLDPEHLSALCTRTFEIKRGTGRFKNVTGGSLTMTETLHPLLANALNMPAFFESSGEFKGTISGVGAVEGERKDDQQ